MTQLDDILSVPARARSPDRAPRGRIALIDDDAAFAESLAANLADEGFDVQTFTDGRMAVTSLCGGESVDIVLLDWRMPGMSGLETLRELRQNGLAAPVIFLTALSDEIYEEAALIGGAADFIDKSRRFPILMKRIELSSAEQGSRTDLPPPQTGQLRLDALELRFDIFRAFWHGREVGLTLTEFNIVARLARTAGEDVSYREIYDLVHGKDFLAGKGARGYHGNVRTFIKRIRKKFRAIASEFEHIRNYAGFGYRWVAESDEAARGAGSAIDFERERAAQRN